MSVSSIDEYINNLPETAKESVVSFVTFMEDEFPQINPKISFSMPMWWMGAKMYDGYVAVSAARGHFSIHFLDEQYLKQLKAELPACSFGKRCVNIKYGDMDALSVVKKKVKEYFSAKV